MSSRLVRSDGLFSNIFFITSILTLKLYISAIKYLEISIVLHNFSSVFSLQNNKTLSIFVKYLSFLQLKKTHQNMMCLFHWDIIIFEAKRS